jgi:hypothetical protein
MKIVVFGAGKCVGALRGDQVIDLSLAYAKFLKERQNERHPTPLAAALVPSELAMFIDGGTRTLEYAAVALDYLFGRMICLARTARRSCTRQVRSGFMHPIQAGRASPAPVAISLITWRAWLPWDCCLVLVR